jgi:release factor glutamine methyltransferase
MPDTWTVRKLIAWAADYLAGYGVESPRLSGELLLARALGRDRLGLYLAMDQPLTPDELAAFKELIKRRREHEPVAYILGGREFWGLELGVGPGVLVPRPETELLVERGLEALAEAPAPRILDLCTGSGCVALALALERPDAEVAAVDASAEALEAARANARRLGLGERVEFRQGDLYGPLAAGGSFYDLITANPPYVTEAEWEGLPRQITGHEPRSALVAGPEGLEVTRRIIAGARAFLRPLGWLMVELGAGQAAEATEAARAAGVFQSVETAPDLAGVERVLCCQRGDYG